jgi:hypothetical protein
MARSYKKEPWAKIGSPSDKYLASRKLRRQGKFWDLADGAHYKRFYDQWDICDYKWPPMTHVWSHFRSWRGGWVLNDTRKEELRFIQTHGNRRAHRPRCK